MMYDVIATMATTLDKTGRAETASPQLTTGISCNAHQKKSNDSTKKLGPTASAISAALNSNITLQSEVKRRLLEVRCMQVRNRHNASTVISSLSRCWDEDPEYSCDNGSWAGGEKEEATPLPREYWKEFARNRIAERIKNNEIDGEEAKDEARNLRNTTKSLKGIWKYDVNRKWTRRFFVDPEGSMSDLLSDTTTDETELKPTILKKVYDSVQSQAEIPLPLAWKKTELELLQKCVQETWEEWVENDTPQSTGMENKQLKLGLWNNKALFEEVAARLKFSPPRHVEEYRVAFFTSAGSDVLTSKFTKQESLFMINAVRQFGDESGKNVDWYELASKLNSNIQPAGPGSTLPLRRTPWQCFKHYQCALRSPSTVFPPSSPDDDELLLKYIAAHGAQYFYQGDAAEHACRQIFPYRSAYQVKYRTYATLFNPNHSQKPWDVEEERKLALLMRAYCNEKNPIQHASSADHFPRRACKAVSEKWNRSLNPELSYRPFTLEEDDKLLNAAKKYGVDKSSSSNGWESIAKQFPHRNRDVLFKRWALLAKENEVASHCENNLIMNSVAKRGTVSGDGNALLSPDDFAVRRKKRKVIF